MQPGNTLDIVFFVIGGLGLFLFGMRVMNDALRRVAGEGLRRILHALTRSVLRGVLVGAVITGVIQSSGAVTVMVVGFVNAGLMDLRQAIGVIMGANIGTTSTAWIVSTMGVLKITNYALPAIGLGLAMNLAGKRNWKHWGMVLLGFGMLFFGLSLMKAAFDPLGESEAVRAAVGRWASNPFLGVLIGTVMTIVIQSSSATIAIAQFLAFSGVLTFPQALPIIFGDNIGTTVTANIVAIGTNVNAKRAARAHLMFNVLGVCILMPLVVNGWYAKFIEMLVPGTLTKHTIMAHLAMSHTAFNVINTLVFLRFTNVLAAVVTRMVPGKVEVVQFEPQYLEERLLDNPPIALEQARREVVRMIELADSAVRDAGRAFVSDDDRELDLVRQKEDAIDNLQDKITRYLIQVSQRNLSPAESNTMPVLLHSVNDIERIGDHAVNLAEAAERKIGDKLPFTGAAMEELGMMRAEVDRMFETVIRALANSDQEVARAAFESEAKLNVMEREFRDNHLRRLYLGDCNFYSGLTFVDCVYNYEKIGDHLMNVAQAVLGDFQWGEKVRDAATSHPAPTPAAASRPAPSPDAL